MATIPYEPCQGLTKVDLKDMVVTPLEMLTNVRGKKSDQVHIPVATFRQPAQRTSNSAILWMFFRKFPVLHRRVDIPAFLGTKLGGHVQELASALANSAFEANLKKIHLFEHLDYMMVCKAVASDWNNGTCTETLKTLSGLAIGAGATYVAANVAGLANPSIGLILATCLVQEEIKLKVANEIDEIFKQYNYTWWQDLNLLAKITEDCMYGVQIVTSCTEMQLLDSWKGTYAKDRVDGADAVDGSPNEFAAALGLTGATEIVALGSDDPKEEHHMKLVYQTDHMMFLLEKA